MPNVMEMRNLRNKPSRNGFDLSTNKLFTARLGEILPVYCALGMPGDRFEIYPKHFTRTQPLNSAAYASITEQVNFFKVPLNILFNRFNTFVVDMQENPQTATSIGATTPISDKLPYITEYQLAQVVHFLATNHLTDELGYFVAPRVVKLLQHLGYGDYSQYVSTGPISNIPSRRLSPFPLLAYQKIYFDYFRYQQWENSSPWCFNINYANFDSQLDIAYLLADMSRYADCLFTPRYSNFKKDYFLGVLPSPQYGDSSVIPVNSGETSVYSLAVYKKSDVNSWPTSGASQVASITSSSVASVINSMVSNPSIISLRKAEAIQKLREIQISGDQDYKEQIEKIFGISASDHVSDMCTWLGGYDSSINISEVVNQNLSDSVANIQGKATSNSGGKIQFEVGSEFCLIIGVYTSTPKLYYDISAPNSVAQLTHLDHFPNPVLDRIGMETVPFQDVFGYGDISANITTPYGYAPRYFKFKTSYDEVLGGFKKSSDASGLQSWVAPYSDFTNILNNAGTPESSYLMFKVNPNILNSIMATQVLPDAPDTATNIMMAKYWTQEQFLCNMSIPVAVVRNLDYDGLPY